MLGALIGGGISLLGGLFGRSDKKKQEQRQHQLDEMMGLRNLALVEAGNKERLRIAKELANTPLTFDAKGFMKGAEAAGFNPVTFMQGGGMALYTKGHNAAAAAQIAVPDVFQWGGRQAAEIPSIGSVAANALSTGFSIYQDGANRLADQAFQKEMLGLQLNAVQASNARRSRSFNVPFTVGAGTATRSGGGGTYLRSPFSDASIEAGQRTATNPYRMGNVDPTVPDAEMAETRYGDLGQELFGATNALNDLWYGITGKTSAERYKAWEPVRAELGQAAKTAAPYLSMAWDWTKNILPDFGQAQSRSTGTTGSW